MTTIEQTIKDLRPKLRDIAPYTYWFSVGFAAFNFVVGLAILNTAVLYTVKLLGAIPLPIWGMLFIAHGLAMALALFLNNWKTTRALHAIGIGMKAAWWLELLAAWTAGRSPFLLLVWSLLIYLQFVVWYYFTPKVGRRD